MQYRSINVDAMRAALELTLGAEGSEAIAKLYLTLENAFVAGFNEGFDAARQSSFNDEAEGRAYEDGYQDGQDSVEAYEYLHSQGFSYDEVNEAFDNGYLDGVRDQKEGIADDVIELIMADRAAEAAELAYEDAFNEEPVVHEFAEGSAPEFKKIDLNELMLRGYAGSNPEFTLSNVTDSGDETK